VVYCPIFARTTLLVVFGYLPLPEARSAILVDPWNPRSRGLNAPTVFLC